jgi:hypothetical protein
MNNKFWIVFVAIFSILGMNGSQAATDFSIDGFIDTTYVLSDGISDGPSPYENKFDVNSELDLKAPINDQMSARLDYDFNLVGNSGFGDSDSGKIEQGYFAWQAPQSIVLKAGVFNNPIGWEAEDAPDLYQISHGQIYRILDEQTALYGNNVAGAAVTGIVGPINVTGAILNDLGNAPEKQSFAGLVNYVPKEGPARGLDLELGFVTQDTQAETIVDMNGTFQRAMLTVGGELLFGSKQVDLGVGVTGNIQLNDQLSATLRLDSVSYEGGLKDTRSVTFAVGYLIDKNLTANAELRLNDDGNDTATSPGIIGDGDLIQFELIALF